MKGRQGAELRGAAQVNHKKGYSIMICEVKTTDMHFANNELDLRMFTFSISF